MDVPTNAVIYPREVRNLPVARLYPVLRLADAPQRTARADGAGTVFRDADFDFLVVRGALAGGGVSVFAE